MKTKSGKMKKSRRTEPQHGAELKMHQYAGGGGQDDPAACFGFSIGLTAEFSAAHASGLTTT